MSPVPGRQKGESVKDCVSRAIKQFVDEGMPQKQAVPAAFRKCGAPPPGGKK